MLFPVKQVKIMSQPTPEPPTQQVENLKLENGTATPPATNNDASSASFSEIFKAFAKFGDPKSDGKQITLSNSDKWMKQAKVIDGKKITTTDTGIYFKKLKSQKVSISDYEKFLDDLAKSKKIEVQEIKTKLTNCGLPGHHGVGVKFGQNSECLNVKIVGFFAAGEGYWHGGSFNRYVQVYWHT